VTGPKDIVYKGHCEFIRLWCGNDPPRRSRRSITGPLPRSDASIGEFNPERIKIMQNTEIKIINGMGDKCTQFRANLLQWGRQHFRQYPWRDPSATLYEVLIAELLLKRTTAAAVARVYRAFLNRFPTLEAINKSTEEDLAKVLSAIGLQQQRAKSIKALAYYLSIRHSGMVPRDLQKLLDVPGLGEYSARAVLSFGCKIPIAIVDVNVKRVLVRVFLSTISNKPPDRLIQQIADSLLTIESHREHNFALLDLGSSICRYINPIHDKCLLSSICDYHTQSKGGLIKKTLNKDETNIGTKIHKIRTERKISLVKLARLSGLSKLTIINIEAGKTEPKKNTIKKIAHVLDVDPGTL
jgi:A/G-specific adenine glycosylase